MRRTRLFSLLGAAILVIGAAAGVSYAQGMGTGQSGMMPMGTMMDHMHDVMGEISQMVAHAKEGGKTSQSMMHGQPEMMSGGRNMMPGSEEITSMVKGTDSVAHAMNGLMQQMESMMGNQKLKEDPSFARNLQQMQQSMSTMMQGFDGFVDGVKAIDQQPPSN